jgi:hypothetical protein
MGRSSKYGRLNRWFESQPKSSGSIRLSFAQIEQTLRQKLPRSAREYEAWWLDASPNTSHVQAVAWLEAGWRVASLDLGGQTVTFEPMDNA